MNKIHRSLISFFCLVLAFFLVINNVIARDDQDILDILNYKIEAEIIPDTHTLKATTDVTFQVSKATQSVIFEMNGALKVSKITTVDSRELQFVQDSLDALNLRIDLGTQIPANQPFTLKFTYEGMLTSPQGGVLANKRLAYIGSEGSYLTYASRWFPFHGYASDIATYQISLIAPSDLTVVGLSTQPVESRAYVPPSLTPVQPEIIPEEKTPEKVPPKKPTAKKPVPQKTTPQKAVPQKTSPSTTPTVKKPTTSKFFPTSFVSSTKTISSANSSVKIDPQDPSLTTTNSPRNIHTFISTQAVLPGTFAIARYINRNAKSGSVDIDFYVKPGSEVKAQTYAQTVAQAVDVYNSKFGNYAFGNKLVFAEVDNETLDTLTTAGISLLAEKNFKLVDTPSELLYRETAYQWWGQAVILKSFDDVWLSQGLAQYSALSVLEANSPEGAFRETARGAMERAMAFEAQTSISRAPTELDDQSEAYRSIVFYKGAFVFRMLRLVIGNDIFDKLIQTYYQDYKGKQASITNFETLANKVVGKDMRYFFGQWVDATGVPEFRADYQMLRTKGGAFKVRGTINQDVDSFNMPIDVELLYEGGSERTQLNMVGKTVDFSFEAKGKPLDIVVDPDSKLLKVSEDIRVSVIVRRGIEHFRNDEYPEAEQQFQAAIKLNRSSSWAWYNLGLLYFAQKNYPKANDAFGEALELDLQPRWVQVWSHIKRGNCYDSLGQRERAVAEYKKAIEVGDNYDNAQQAAQQYLSAPYRRDQENQQGQIPSTN
ncbi:MAG: tetratricopeptide repeat protein [Acidobacteria bacterium]|nr:tetratricopeptide repeat protein [Acidobacteriota bacterium]